MFEYPFVRWNMYKLTSTGKGSMHAAQTVSTLGTRYWKGYPCHYLRFRFSNLTGRILSFSHFSTYYPNSPGIKKLQGMPYNHENPCMTGALVVAYDWPKATERQEGTKKRFTDSSLYLLVDRELPEETSSRAAQTLDKTIETYNNKYGFTPYADYHGFSAGDVWR